MKMCFTLMIVAATLSCNQTSSQKQGSKPNGKHIGGQCEGCEAIYESPVPFEKLTAVDTLPDFYNTGPKLVISGMVYKADGRTPAKDIVIYVYHTDQNGLYPKKGNESGWGKRHGYIRGWAKTDKNGAYQFVTLKPAAYPGRNIPAHIHITIKEPDKNEYWIDEYLFDDDPLLTKEERQKQENRGGNGIIKLSPNKAYLQGKRNIILGKNIPGYPA
jgi:protocatechuate 3,4-dioxygenase, beta subunit